ncbi:hypothetical protein TNCV_1796781 [Trichonephila clavipes]|nr:hypothetical protein TNCV_1796781 [Trichonephila clavipes]
MDKCVQMLDKELWRLGSDGGCVLACDAQIGRGEAKVFVTLPIRRDEGRVVNTPLVFKRFFYRREEERERKGRTGKGERESRRRRKEKKRSRGERERAALHAERG